MNRKQLKFIKEIESKSVEEIARFVSDGNISWEELVANSFGRFPLVKQRLVKTEIESMVSPQMDIDEGTVEIDDYQSAEQPVYAEVNYNFTEEHPTEDNGYPNNVSQYSVGDEDVERSIEPKVSAVPTPKHESKWYNCKGRIGRLIWFAITLCCNIACRVLGFLIGSMYYDGTTPAIFLLVALLLFVIWISICANCKRCHDLGHSGWFQLIPFYGLFMLFVPGNLVDNQYGPSK